VASLLPAKNGAGRRNDGRLTHSKEQKPCPAEGRVRDNSRLLKPKTIIRVWENVNTRLNCTCSFVLFAASQRTLEGLHKYYKGGECRVLISCL
jgi:hypothetical protein